MARESKRKREERRFGRPERLADKITQLNWRMPAWVGRNPSTSKDAEGEARAIGELCLRSRYIVADNVANYFVSGFKDEWVFERDFPTPMPPFNPVLIEFAGVGPMPQVGLNRFGWVFALIEKVGGEPRIPDLIAPYFDRGILPFLRQPDVAVGVIACCLTEVIFGQESKIVPCTYMVYGLDGDYQMVDAPFSLHFGKQPVEDFDEKEFLCSMFAPALLTLSFMNCQGVTLREIEPDQRLNRERRRVGQRPLVRYHTIQIGPADAVLRNEGGLETNGLKRALHICRGHFATYKDSFLGRKLDRPVTVWRPAHVRGYASEGVVFSDYRVNPPK